MNQCDGCQAGIPVDRNGHHRMGGMVKHDGTPSTYPNLQGCTAHLYGAKPTCAGEHVEGKHLKTLGRCWNLYECKWCGKEFQVDSGD